THAVATSSSSPPVAASLHDPVPVPLGPASAWPWERRQLAFLRATLAPSADRAAGAAIARALQFLIEKAESFGGRVEALGPLGLVAVFGHEPVEDAPRRAAHASVAMRKAGQRAQPASAD